MREDLGGVVIKEARRQVGQIPDRDLLLLVCTYGLRDLDSDDILYIVNYSAGMALKFLSEILSDEQIDACAIRNTQAAVMYASARLTDDRLADLIKLNPIEALEFAINRLSADQIAECRIAAAREMR